MYDELVHLENEFWQVGILPDAGASVAFGRVVHNHKWLDVMRPTAPADYGNSSKAASFIMLPWCNRIRDGKFSFDGQDYTLRTEKDDGTARHGDVRKRPWERETKSIERVALRFESSDFADINFPFKFSARAIYWLEQRDFVMWLSLKNEDTRPMPGGFGHHPYFARPGGESAPHIQIPCGQMFALDETLMAVAPPVPVSPELDFRTLRKVEGTGYNHVLTGRIENEVARLVYPQQGIEISMHMDAVFEHILIFTPTNEPSLAIEPMTNVSNGFNLYTKGVAGTGVFVLQPGEEKNSIFRLRVNA